MWGSPVLLFPFEKGGSFDNLSAWLGGASDFVSCFFFQEIILTIFQPAWGEPQIS